MKRKARTSKHILRPRTAFNFFYSHQRDAILNEKSRATYTKNDNTCDNGSTNNWIGRDILRKKPRCNSQGMHHLTKIVAKRWKEVDSDTRKKYVIMAEKDRLRYSKEMLSIQKPQQEFSIPKLLPFENSALSTQDASTIKKVQHIDERGTYVNADDLFHIHGNLRNEESVRGNVNSLSTSKCSSFEYIDGLGIKWSAGELDILKQLL